jgi:mitochondrial fission protein ELM1
LLVKLPKKTDLQQPQDEIWILDDGRPGTVSQSIGLAEAIGFSETHKIIKLDYGFFAALPNFFLSDSLLGLTNQCARKFKNQTHFPRLIISAGRRCAPIALHFKKKSQNKSKVIQIMNPNLDFKKFDLVVLPKHDGFSEKDFPNLVTTIGALTKVDEKIIAQEQEKFSSWFRNFKKTKIALIVGGSSKGGEFELESAIRLAKNSSNVAKNMDATLLILNSRRTSPALTQAIKSNLDCNFKFFDFEETKNNNPYLAILGESDFFIITGDSVSMISECCSTGKPTYIFDEKNISSKKHRQFHQNLFDENFAKIFSSELSRLENFSSKKLQETKRIALIAHDKIRTYAKNHVLRKS